MRSLAGLERLRADMLADAADVRPSPIQWRWWAAVVIGAPLWIGWMVVYYGYVFTAVMTRDRE